MGHREGSDPQVLEGVVSAIRTRKAVASHDGRVHDWDTGMGSWGRRCRPLLGASAVIWQRINRRAVFCVALACVFNAVFIVPPIMIFGNRTLPFDTVMVFPKTPFAAAGSTVVNVFVVKDVRNECASEFDRFFTDSQGNRYFLGTHRGSYRHGLDMTEGRRFEREWKIPDDARTGPAMYEAEPRFWCNWFQQIVPIKAPTVRIPINVVDRSLAIQPSIGVPMPAMPFPSPVLR